MRGDFALVMIPVVIGIIGGAPEAAWFTPIVKYWTSSGLTLTLTAFKFWTNTKKDEDPTPGNDAGQ